MLRGAGSSQLVLGSNHGDAEEIGLAGCSEGHAGGNDDALAAKISGEEAARAIQLVLEYDPQPPYDSGSPEKAGPELESKVRQFFENGFSFV